MKPQYFCQISSLRPCSSNPVVLVISSPLELYGVPGDAGNIYYPAQLFRRVFMHLVMLSLVGISIGVSRLYCS